MKKLLNDSENRIFSIVFLIVMFVACSKLMTKLCVNGHDIEYHLLRIEALKEGILIGKPLLKVNVLFLGGAGYASSMFYPDFLLYIPALLRVAGFGINSSYHIFVAVCILLCFISTYYATKGICKDKYAGLIAGIIITLCNYHLDDIYVRGAVGEYTAFIFIPLIIYGIYNTLYENMDKPYIISVGFMGLLLCHTLSFAICLMVAVFVCIVRIKEFIRNPKLIIKLTVTALISAAITCWYWLPMMEQLLVDKFYVTEAQWIDPAQGALQMANVFSSVFPTLGFAVVVFCIPGLIVKCEKDNNSFVFAKLLILIAAGFVFLSTDLFPWKRFGKYLSSVQFPWRFFLIASVCFAMAAGISLANILGSVKIKKIFNFSDTEGDNDITVSILNYFTIFTVLAVMSLTAFASFSGNNQGYYDYSLDYYSNKPFTANIIAGEWLPSRVQDRDEIVNQSEHAIANDGTDVGFERYKNELTVNVDSGYEFIDVPFVYYVGYKAIGDSGENIEIDGNGSNGLARIYPNDYRGNVRVFYKGTVLNTVASVVSVFSLMVVLAVYLIFRRKNKL